MAGGRMLREMGVLTMSDAQQNRDTIYPHWQREDGGGAVVMRMIWSFWEEVERNVCHDVSTRRRLPLLARRNAALDWEQWGNSGTVYASAPHNSTNMF